MLQISIIIATHKRSAVLARCLEHLEKQTMVDALEVIVVSDGHDEDTASLFKEKTWRMPVKFFEVRKSQQGKARNEGVKRAQAPLCFFINDDILLKPDACERHLAVHATSNVERGTWNVAVLGFTTWDSANDITPVMRWLERSGWQFGYPHIAPYAGGFIPQHLQHLFTYTSHISLPTEIARKYAFREDITLYGWEDIEWGMRLRDAGVRLFYEPHARALHHHHIDLNASLQRMEILGMSAVHLQKLAPEFDRVPHGWKLIAYRIAAMLPTMAGRHRKAFLRGIRRAESETIESGK